MPSTPAAVIAKAEEDSHVEEELRRAKEGAPVSLEDVKALLGDTDSNLSGVESTAELMTVYNRYDGVPSRITTDQANQRLRVRFESLHVMAGQLVWTTKPPETAPAVGTLLCPLHPDSEERKYLDGLHFEGKVCAKSTMKTLYDRDMHFEHGHPAIYKAVEKDRAKQLQLQQMELMKQQTAAMQTMAAQNGTGTEAAGQPGADTSATISAIPELAEKEEARCHSCNEVIEGKLADHSCSPS